MFSVPSFQLFSSLRVFITHRRVFLHFDGGRISDFNGANGSSPASNFTFRPDQVYRPEHRGSGAAREILAISTGDGLATPDANFGRQWGSSPHSPPQTPYRGEHLATSW